MPIPLPRFCRLLVVVTLAIAASTHAATAASPPVQLQLWTWSMRPWFNSYCSDLTAAFERSHPGVTVQWVDVPDEAIVRKYFAAGAAGQLPDVVNLPDKVFLRFATLGGLLPLDSVLPGDPNLVYVKPALEQCRISGRQLGLPWYLSTEISMINPTLLADGDLTPATIATHWDELLAQAKPFHEKTGRHLFMLRLGETDLLNMIMAEGLKPIEPLPTGGFRSNLLDPQVVALMERWVQAVRDGDLPRESATAGYAETVAEFKEQRIALLNADAVRAIKNDAPSLYENLILRPGVTGSIQKTAIAASEIAVGAQTRYPKLAAELAWFMTSPPWQERLCLQASRIPGTSASLSLPAFALSPEPQDKLKLAMKIGCAQLRDGHATNFIPPTGQWPDMMRLFGDEMKRSMLQGVPVRTSLERVDGQWNELLAAEAANH